MAFLRQAFLLLALASCGQLCVPEGPREGLRAPSFETTLVDGSPIRSTDLDDKPTVLVFWASWCGPCMQEVPQIEELHRSMGDTIHVLAVNGGEPGETVASTVHHKGITYPVAMDPGGRIQQRFEVQSIPLVVILDRDRIVRYRGNGLPVRVNALLQGLVK